MGGIQAGRPTSMRNLNKKIVLDLMKKERILSRVDLCKRTGLKPPTMSNIISELLNENLILHHGKGQPSKKGGPSPDLYRINSTGRYFIGIDVRVNGIFGLLLDLEGNIVYDTLLATSYPSRDEFSRDLKKIVYDILQNSHTKLSLIEGIGVAIAALVDANQGQIKAFARLKHLNDFKVKDLLEQEFGLKTYVDNDINLLAAGQKYYMEDGREAKNTLCMGIRSGIGLGIITDGKLYRGSNGLSSNIGCFEDAENEETMIEKVKEFYRNNPSVNIADLGVKAPEEIQFDKLCLALQQEQPVIVELFKDYCESLGRLAGKLIQLFNPDCIFVTSRIFYYNAKLFAYLSDAAQSFCMDLQLQYGKVPLVKLPLTETSVAYCAAYHILQEFFNARNVFF